MAGGLWHDQHAALCDLPHYTRICDTSQQPVAVTSSDERQLGAAADSLPEFNVS